MRRLIALVLTLGSVAITTTGCSKDDSAPAQSAGSSDRATPAQAASPASAPDSFGAVLNSPDRLAGDAKEDAHRNPTEILRLLELRPGMKVIDYFAGGGYYTELLSRLVGPEGTVIAYNNDAYMKYAADKPAQRYGNDRLSNVQQVTSAPESLSIDDGTLDAALIVNAYHDLHWKSKDGSWPSTDPKASLAALARALKPNAVVVVLDHVAEAGSDPATSVDALHRIDPEVIKSDFAAAGFELETQSDAFRNPQDKLSVGVFDPAVLHKTDRVLFKFRKK
jgi:predicted methyltransferase